MNDETKDLIPSVFEVSLEAQLRAVRPLRQGQPVATESRHRKGLSQVDMAFDILKKSRSTYLRHPAHPNSVRRNGRSRKPGFFPHQEGRSRRPFSAPGKEHLRGASGGAMSLLSEFLVLT
jgi:hypothetical protein